LGQVSDLIKLSNLRLNQAIFAIPPAIKNIDPVGGSVEKYKEILVSK
jgi:hypothetical protein